MCTNVVDCFINVLKAQNESVTWRWLVQILIYTIEYMILKVLYFKNKAKKMLRSTKFEK